MSRDLEGRKEGMRGQVMEEDVGRDEGPGGPERSGGPPGLAPRPGKDSDPEVNAKAVRRSFSAKYKAWILDRVDSLKESGQIGRFLRQEGLYSSHLVKWRKQRESGNLSGSHSQRRGRKVREKRKAEEELGHLREENRRLKKKLEQAEAIIEIQKKISTLLELPHPSNADGGNG